MDTLDLIAALDIRDFLGGSRVKTDVHPGENFI